MLSVMLCAFSKVSCGFAVECGVWKVIKLIENIFSCFGFAMVSAMGNFGGRWVGFGNNREGRREERKWFVRCKGQFSHFNFF